LRAFSLPFFEKKFFLSLEGAKKIRFLREERERVCGGVCGAL